MLIEGPIQIGVIPATDSTVAELHIDFIPEFRALDVAEQAKGFRRYLQTLRHEIGVLPVDDVNRAGMLTVQQIGEQLLPHVVAGELALEETIVIEIAPESPVVSITDLLNS